MSDNPFNKWVKFEFEFFDTFINQVDFEFPYSNMFNILTTSESDTTPIDNLEKKITKLQMTSVE